VNSKWVYAFDEVDQAQESVGGEWDDVRALLGGKGANLGDMTRIGVPVPPGFTITTEACNAYLAGGRAVPRGHAGQVASPWPSIEAAAGKRFGDPDNPLLVSCRSGAKFSMPGMMDTVLNIGLNDDVAKGLIGSPTTSISSTTPTAAWCRCSGRWCSAFATSRSSRCWSATAPSAASPATPT
jgi:pyruvate, orthophosphate dikinase